jgi:DNA-binding SARP family transcriptional activator
MGDATRAQQAYLAAIACYGGDYYVDDADLSCQLAERERLLATYLAALDQLGRIFMAQRLFEQAAECYRRLVERDEYREDAHMQVMRCYLELGRRSDALQQYEHCVAILRNDLGLDPMPGTRQLYEAILGL